MERIVVPNFHRPDTLKPSYQLLLKAPNLL